MSSSDANVELIVGRNRTSTGSSFDMAEERRASAGVLPLVSHVTTDLYVGKEGLSPEEKAIYKVTYTFTFDRWSKYGGGGERTARSSASFTRWCEYLPSWIQPVQRRIGGMHVPVARLPASRVLVDNTAPPRLHPFIPLLLPRPNHDTHHTPHPSLSPALRRFPFAATAPSYRSASCAAAASSASLSCHSPFSGLWRT